MIVEILKTHPRTFSHARGVEKVEDSAENEKVSIFLSGFCEWIRILLYFKLLSYLYFSCICISPETCHESDKDEDEQAISCA